MSVCTSLCVCLEVFASCALLCSLPGRLFISTAYPPHTQSLLSGFYSYSIACFPSRGCKCAAWLYKHTHTHTFTLLVSSSHITLSRTYRRGVFSGRRPPGSDIISWSDSHSMKILFKCSWKVFSRWKPAEARWVSSHMSCFAVAVADIQK